MIHLLERSTADKISDKQLMPIVLIQCRRCKALVHTAYIVCAVCAAGVVDCRICLRSKLIRICLKGNAMFSEITRSGAREHLTSRRVLVHRGA